MAHNESDGAFQALAHRVQQLTTRVEAVVAMGRGGGVCGVEYWLSGCLSSTRDFRDLGRLSAHTDGIFAHVHALCHRDTPPLSRHPHRAFGV
jgi:hypothetical protein